MDADTMREVVAYLKEKIRGERSPVITVIMWASFAIAALAFIGMIAVPNEIGRVVNAKLFLFLAGALMTLSGIVAVFLTAPVDENVVYTRWLADNYDPERDGAESSVVYPDVIQHTVNGKQLPWGYWESGVFYGGYKSEEAAIEAYEIAIGLREDS